MDLPVFISWDVTSLIMMSVTMVGNGQNSSTQASAGKVRMLRDTRRDWIANQQRFYFVTFLATNRFPFRWHWLGTTTLAPDNEQYSTFSSDICKNPCLRTSLYYPTTLCLDDHRFLVFPQIRLRSTSLA